MKIKKILLKVAVGIGIIYFIIVLSYLKVFITPKLEEKDAIEKFYNNKSLFLKSSNQLKKYENIISLDKSSSFGIFLSGYEYNTNINKKVVSFKYQIYNKKYSNMFVLMKKTNISSIYKDKYGNIKYTFETPLIINQSIVYLEDLNGFKMSGYEIEKLKNIEKKWYYIETK